MTQWLNTFESKYFFNSVEKKTFSILYRKEIVAQLSQCVRALCNTFSFQILSVMYIQQHHSPFFSSSTKSKRPDTYWIVINYSRYSLFLLLILHLPLVVSISSCLFSKLFTMESRALLFLSGRVSQVATYEGNFFKLFCGTTPANKRAPAVSVKLLEIWVENMYWRQNQYCETFNYLIP